MLNHILSQTATAENTDDRKFITALARGLSVLSAFEDKPYGLSHQEICTLTNLPKATVSRLTYTLTQTGFLYLEGDKYKLGIASLMLGQHAQSHHDLITKAKPFMQEFAKMHQVSVSLATYDAGQMLYVASVRSPAKITVQLSIGSRLPLITTSVGRTFFALSSQKEREHILSQLATLYPDHDSEHTLQTLQTHADFYHTHGYCISNGEFSDDIMAVAVGVYNPTKQAYTHAINASVPAGAWQEAQYVAFIKDKLQALATDIAGMSVH